MRSAKGILEKDIERGILNYLSLLPNIRIWKQNTLGVFDSKRGTYRMPHSPHIKKGISDIIGIIRHGQTLNSERVGRFLAIEIKTPHRRRCLSGEQKEFIEMINDFGGLAFVATSIEEVKEIFAKEQLVLF